MTCEFKSNPACTACPLHEGVQSVCIPTRLFQPCSLTVRGKQALLCLGEAPAANEDAANECFIGESGGVLRDCMACLGVPDLDIYVGNLLRCRLPKQANPTDSQYKACRPYLLDDIRHLLSVYSGRLTLLLLGGSAVRGILRTSVKKALKRQGELVLLHEELEHIPVYSTYHPAYALPGRSPATIAAIADHLTLLSRRLRGESDVIQHGEVDYLVAPPVESASPDSSYPLSLDIETYGILTSFPEQTVFHPQRSIHTDGIASEDLVQTAAISWAEDGLVVKTGVFNLTRMDHQNEFFKWVQYVYRKRRRWVFSNAPFDLSYLREWDQAFRLYLRHEVEVEDIQALSYLVSDVRPERSLKALSTLLGVAKYGQQSKEFVRYDRPDHPELLAYHALDAEATLRCYIALQHEIEEAYPDSPKLSLRTRQWYSDIIWLCVYLMENGCCLDFRQLTKLGQSFSSGMAALLSKAKKQGFKLAGKGSDKCVRNLISDAAAHAGLLTHPELERTPTKGEISVGANNVRLVQAHLSGTDPLFGPVEWLRRYGKLQKLLGTYVRPMTGYSGVKMKHGQVDRRQVLIRGTAYPTCFPFPSQVSDYDPDDTEGGTKQGRLSYKNPSLPTNPKTIKACKKSRHRPGFLLGIDLSRIELVVAAFLSGDDRMLTLLQESDLHQVRAVEIFGESILDLPKEEFSKLRHVGKTDNFRAIYRGSEYLLRITIRAQTGLDYSLEKCREIAAGVKERYPDLWAWQDSLIEEVDEKGYLMDPILGQGRLFTQSPTTNRQDYESTICNFMVQQGAANIMLWAQSQTEFSLRRRGLLTRTTLNVYDSEDLDGPLHEYDEAREIALHYLRHNQYVKWLEEHYGRSFPLSWEEEVRYF